LLSLNGDVSVAKSPYEPGPATLKLVGGFALAGVEEGHQLIEVSEANEVTHPAQAIIVINRTGNADHEVGQVLLPVFKGRKRLAGRLDILLNERAADGVVERDDAEVAVVEDGDEAAPGVGRLRMGRKEELLRAAEVDVEVLRQSLTAIGFEEDRGGV